MAAILLLLLWGTVIMTMLLFMPTLMATAAMSFIITRFRAATWCYVARLRAMAVRRATSATMVAANALLRAMVSAAIATATEVAGEARLRTMPRYRRATAAASGATTAVVAGNALLWRMVRAEARRGANVTG